MCIGHRTTQFATRLRRSIWHSWIFAPKMQRLHNASQVPISRLSTWQGLKTCTLLCQHNWSLKTYALQGDDNVSKDINRQKTFSDIWSCVCFLHAPRGLFKFTLRGYFEAKTLPIEETGNAQFSKSRKGWLYIARSKLIYLFKTHEQTPLLRIIVLCSFKVRKHSLLHVLSKMSPACNSFEK